MQEAGHGEIWSVTQIVQRIKQLLATEFPPLWIEGEISNYSRAGSGHRYFTLKDDRNQLKAALFRGRARGLQFEPEDGLKVVAFGQLDLYGPRSEYQLIVEQLMPAGLGELELAFRQLHERLEKEGLFAADRKRPLPEFPRRIGIVTSARSAAVRDMLKVLGRRAPHVEVVIADTLVQGERAAAQIVAAIERFNRARNVDLLLVGRGGGSLEDLWPFNEEPVVRAVAASTLPVVSGVGHEVDRTLCDLAADLRAPTPSAAAELAVRDRAEWRAQLDELSRRLGSEIEYQVDHGRSQLTSLVQRYGFRRPQEILATFTRRIDELTQRLKRGGEGAWRERLERARYVGERPALSQTDIWLRPLVQSVHHAGAALRAAWPRVTVRVRERLAGATGGLDALSPRAVLDRGYAVLLDQSNSVVTSVDDVEVGDALRAMLADGEVSAHVDRKKRGTSWP